VLASGEYNIGLVTKMKDSLRRALTLDQVDIFGVERRLKDASNRSVDLLSVEDSPCVILKSVELDNLEELFIHKELSDFVQQDSRLSILIPTFYSSKYGDKIHIFSEYIPGATFTDAKLEMSDGEISLTLRVLHGFLSYLRRHLGFVHGDLTTNNIILRGWKSDRNYEVPLIVDGEVTMIEMSFVPVIFDFGLSTTTKYSRLCFFRGPLASSFNDCVLLYSSLSDLAQISHIQRVTERIRTILGPDWVGELGEGLYLPPLPLICNQLTHDYLLSELSEK
jgi:serine/threonine protein kinase